MPKADMAQLSRSLQEVVDTLRPTPEEQQRQKQAFQQVQAVLLQHWPAAQVHLFGSTANCLSICNNNDIDVCLELPEDAQDQVMTQTLAQDPAAHTDVLLAFCILLQLALIRFRSGASLITNVPLMHF